MLYVTIKLNINTMIVTFGDYSTLNVLQLRTRANKVEIC